MMPDKLSEEDRKELLRLARQALEDGVRNKKIVPLELENLSPCLQALGTTFVTLTKKGELRGCIGALDPCLPLAEDVRQHAIAAALEDYRFSPVKVEELDEIEIEVSRLTPPQQLKYDHSEELLSLIRPGIDGVVLKDGIRRATFLPQVWEKIPNQALFLSYLCQKMGCQPDLWQRKILQVYVYQVEEFHEE